MKDEAEHKTLTTASIAGTERPAPPSKRRTGVSEGRAPLLAQEALEDLRKRWASIQSRFVDDPRRSVEHADSLVAELMMRLAESFANERSGLENQWARNEEVDTEALRLALQRYRSFFDRLLDV